MFLLYIDILKNRCCRLTEPDPSRKTNFERLVEGIAIQVALTWEIFARDVYLYSIIEHPSQFKRQFRKRIQKMFPGIGWKPQTPEEVEKILLNRNSNKFLSFKNTSRIIEKAGAHIDRKDVRKNPFLALNPDLVQELDRFAILRHHLVHRSSYSKREFNEAFPGSRSPGEYLKRMISAAKRPQRYNQEYELGYFIKIFKCCLYEMAKTKPIVLPGWPRSKVLLQI